MFHSRLLPTCGFSIAVAIRSLVHSLFVHLIPAGALKGWWAVPTLQTVLFKQALNENRREPR